MSTLIQQTSSTAPLHSKQIREALIILLEFQSHEKYLWENTTRIKDMAKIHWIWTHFKTKKSHMLNIINTHLIFSRFKKNSRLINPPKVVRLTMRMEFWNAKKNMIFSALLGNPHKKGFLTQQAKKIENYLRSHIINRWLLRKWSFHVFFLVNLTGSLTSSCEGVENLFIGGVLRVFSWTSWKF